jgi:large subunit ribosomal protein L29
MELEKIRNLSDGELVSEEQKAAEQLFRLRFQMKLGQNEGVKKLRETKKDVARFKTIARERELGLHGETHKSESSLPKKAAKKTAKTADAKVTKKAAAGSATKSKKEAR